MELKFDLLQALKDTAWQRAKGALNEMLAVEGSKQSGSSNYEDIKEQIEGFVKIIEEHEYNL